MEKEFIPYEQALALKELGFNRRTLAQYNTHQGNEWILTFDLSGNGQYPKGSSACIAPSFSQAFRFFREKHNLDVVIQKMWRWSLNYNPKETFYTYQLFNFTLDRESEEYILKDTALAYKTHEEAELESLKQLIEIVKTKEIC